MLADQSKINPDILDMQATSNPVHAQVIVQIGGDCSAASGYLFICMLKAGMDGEVILLMSISSGELVGRKYAKRTIRIPPTRWLSTANSRKQDLKFPNSSATKIASRSQPL
jgi:hypothetical protein